MKDLIPLPPAELVGKYLERAFWTALQAFFAVVIVGAGFDASAVWTALVAAGLAVVNNVVLPLAARRLNALNATPPADPPAES